MKDDLRNFGPVSTMAPKEAAIFDMNPDRDWLNPISMQILKEAVARKDERVFLNGHEFFIEYGRYLDMPVSGEHRELVRLKRTDGEIVPFGDVSVKKLQNFEFTNPQK
jgi:hypothetical protein